MDSISSADGIVLLFLGSIVYGLLTVAVTFGVWSESEKISRVSYAVDVVVTAMISFCNIEIVFASAAYASALKGFLVCAKVFAVSGVVVLCGSVVFQKMNNKILRNVCLNISTTGGLVLFAYLVQAKY